MTAVPTAYFRPFRVLSGWPLGVVVDGVQGPVWQKRIRDWAGSKGWCPAVEAAELGALVDPALRDPQSLGIPAEFHRLLETAARFPQLLHRLLGYVSPMLMRT